MTESQIEELKDAAERLKSHQMCVKDCKHLWNAHRQCQWCHSMQRDVDVAIVSDAYLALVPRIADLERLREAVENFKLVARYRMGESAGLWERIVEPELAKLTPAERRNEHDQPKRTLQRTLHGDHQTQ